MAIYVKNGKSSFDKALLDYVRNGSYTVLESFFRNEDPELVDDSGNTLLHYAAGSNNVSMTQHFIDCNYDIDIKDHYGKTPLMLAVQSVSLDTAKLLINANANMYFRDDKDRGILPKSSEFKYKRHMFSYNEEKLLDKYRELIRIVLQKIRNDFWNNEEQLISRLRDIDFTLIQAMHLRDVNVTRIMLKNGYSVDERDPETNKTALHEAVRFGDFENVKVLLEHGASVDAQDKDEYPPIYMYDHYLLKDTDQQVKILKVLIEHGALLAPTPKDRVTPSELILQSGKLWAINILMQYNFEWDPRHSLHLLITNKNPNVLQAVRGKKIDVHSIDTLSKSPILWYPAMFGKLNVVRFLLESGADPNVVGEGGKTPFTCPFNYLFALEKGHLPTVRLMLQHGADARISFGDGQTVFDLAIESTHHTLLRPVIAHLAMVESRGETITALIRGKIDSQNAFKIQFENCKEELEMMKDVTLYESITLHKLLTESQPRIIGYARNLDFALKFKKIMSISRFSEPYYSISLQRRVGKAIHLVKLQKEAANVLNKIVKYHIKNYREILCEIVSYLTCADLKNVCKVYDLQEPESLNLNTLFI